MSLHHMLRAASQQQAGGASDPYFEYNTLLLTGDGTNGAQNNTFLDSSTNNFTITRNGNTTQGTFSPYGNLWSNYFDGSGDYLTSATNTAYAVGTGDFTVEAFVYCTGSGDDYGICDTRASTSGAGFWISNSTAASRGFRYGTSGAVILTVTGQVQNTWQHVAVVRSSGTVTIYVDGVSKGSVTDTRNYTDTSCFIGSFTGGSTPYFGYISNFRFVRGTALYTSNFTPSTTPLTAVSGTSLLTCQSNRFKDNSSNNFAITVNGNTSVQRFSPFNPTTAYSASTIGGSAALIGTQVVAAGNFLECIFPSAISVGTQNYTIEMWVYPLSLVSGYNNLVTINPSFQIFINNYTLDFWSNAGRTLMSGSISQLNTWHHIAVVRNGTTVTNYINGVNVGSTTNSSSINSIDKFRLGQDFWDGGNYSFNGYISDFRLNIGTAVYTANFTPPTAPLTAVSNTKTLCSFTNSGISDNTMKNNIETVGNAQVSTSVKKYGTGSLYFDGAGDYLVIPSSPNFDFGTGDFTVECWCYFNSLGGANYAPVFANGYLFYVGLSGQMLVFNGSTNVATGTNGSIAINGWYHLAWTRASGTVRMFVNGTQTGSNTTVTASIGSGAPNQIGRYSTVDLNGYIDDLRITKGYARYTANFTPPTQALPTY